MYLELILLCFVALVAKAQEPCVKLRITKLGLDSATVQATKPLFENLLGMEIPAQEGRDVKAYNIRVRELVPPRFYYTLQTPTSFSWGMQSSLVALTSEVEASKSVFGVTVRKSLDVRMRARNVKIDIFDAKIGLKPDGKGQPEVVSANCRATIEHLDIDFVGGLLGWILNLFKERLGDRVKTAIEGKICNPVKNILMKNVNEKLNSFPVLVSFGNDVVLDYGLLSDQVFWRDHLELAIKGQFNHPEVPADSYVQLTTPMTIPGQDAAANRMLYIKISDKLLNDALVLVHAVNKSRIVFTEDTQFIGPFLKLGCEDGSECLGALIPDAYKRFPGVSAAEIHLESSSPVSVQVSTDGTWFEVNGTLDLFMPAPTRQSLVTAMVNIKGDVQFEIDGKNLVPQIQINEFYVTKPVVQLAQTSWMDLKSGLVPVLKSALRKHVNGVLSNGLPLPLTPGVSLVDPYIRLLDNTVQLEADFNYIRYLAGGKILCCACGANHTSAATG